MHWRSGSSILRSFAVAGLVWACTLGLRAVVQERLTLPLSMGAEKHVVLTPESIRHVLVHPAEQPWRPQVNTERSRGDVATLYQRVAPAVVVIRTDSGHGTGFLIDAQGTIVTNHHVIADGLRHDSARPASYAMVHLGVPAADGTMTLQAEPRPAYVYKFDAAADLALLRLDAVSAGTKLPFLTLADAAPPPGSQAIAVGHPAAGLLWTVRTGEVSSAGRMPADLVNVVMLRLAATKTRRDAIAAELARMPSRRILLTSIGINPGDSGGPITDALGRVIAVTFAVPRDPALAKFSYHVHLTELKAFLTSVPPSPMLVVPDVWSVGPEIELGDADGDRRPDVLLAGDGEEVNGLLLDLDNDTPPALLRDPEALVAGRKWDFEAAIHPASGGVLAFYDTDNDGHVDLILRGAEEAAAHARFTRAATGQWQVQTGKPLQVVSGAHLPSAALSRRMEQVIAAIAKHGPSGR